MMKILVVDDEQSIRETLKLFLQEKGFKLFLTVEDGEKGLQVAEREQPDIVILDFRLPGLDGLEVLQRLKHHNKDISVIMITGYHVWKALSRR